jgi:hypothetical protein
LILLLSLFDVDAAAALGFGLEFVRRVVKEIRSSICGTKAKTGYTGQPQLTKDALAVAVEPSLMALGVTNAMALGRPVLALLVLARACHKAFCEILVEAVGQRSRRERH